jgi:hypothetical protein
MVPDLKFDAGVPGQPPVHTTPYVEAVCMLAAEEVLSLVTKGTTRSERLI